jgi:hypothetical protein
MAGHADVASGRMCFETGHQQELTGTLGAASAVYCKFDVSEFLLIHEEGFDLLQDGWIEVIDMGNAGIKERLGCNSYQTVIPVVFTCLFSLMRFNEADQGAFQKVARKGRLLNQNQNVDSLHLPLSSLARTQSHMGTSFPGLRFLKL